jgi:Tol biopolymer transport system component
VPPATAPAPDVDSFLDRLEAEGYGVGVRERLLAHALLARCAESGDLPDGQGDQLRLLEPLVSRDEHEQRRFESLVATFLRQPATRGGPDEDEGTTPGGTRIPRRVVFVVALVVAAVLLVWWPWPGREPVVEKGSGAGVVDTTDVRGPTLVPPAETVAPPIYVPVGGFPDAAELASAPAPAVPGAVRWMLGAVGTLLALAVAAWLVRRRNRVGYLQSVRTDEDLEEHVLRDPGSVVLPIPDAAVRPASRMLRQRIAGSREVLDLRATLQATVRAGGALAARYRPLHQTPEYLVLVDRVSARDHQAAFHELLVGALARHGVAVDLFYYDGSPDRGCWRARSPRDEDGPGGGARTLLTVAQLSNRYGGHRLLVFGDAACAFDPLRGRPAAWARHVGQFPGRAWFSPLPLASWGAAEAGVDTLGFLLLPSQPESLESLGEWLASDRATLQADADWPGPYPASLRGNAASWVARQAPPPGEALEELLFELRTYLGPARFQWLCACAIFPAVSWPLTLSLGREVMGGDGPAHPAALARGVAALGALPWFRYGRMPAWLREALLDRVDPAREARLRGVVERRLSAALVDAPGATLAEVAVRRRMLGWFVRRQGMARDVVLAGFLAKGPPNRLVQRLPQPLQRLLFPGGKLLYGLRPAVPAAGGMVATLCLLAIAPGVWQAWAAPPGEPTLGAYAELQGHGGGVSDAAFSPDGQRVVTASFDSTARVWRVGAPERAMVLRGHANRVRSAAFSPDGQRIVTASDDGTVRVWRADGAGSPVVLRGHGAPVTSAEFSPDGRRIITASADGTARLWPADGSGPPVVFTSRQAPLNHAVFSPDGRWIAASNDSTVQLWRTDGPSGSWIVLRGHAGRVRSAAFSPDGQRIVTASDDGTARVWGGKGTVLRVLRNPSGAAMWSAAFSPDGQHIVTASADRTARVWRADGFGRSVVLRGHEGQVVSATFSPDGQRIVTASFDGTSGFWGRRPGVPVNITTCGIMLANYGLRDEVDQLAGDARFAPVVYAEWDAARLGPEPSPGRIHYAAGDAGSEALADTMEAYLLALGMQGAPGRWDRVATPVPSGTLMVSPCFGTAAPLPRTYVYYKDPADSAVARVVAHGLSQRRYDVRGPSARPNATNTETENIRYFHREDLPAARMLASAVHELLDSAEVAGFQPRVNGRLRAATRPDTLNHLEVWLPPLEFAPTRVAIQVHSRETDREVVMNALRTLRYPLRPGAPNEVLPPKTPTHAIWYGPGVPLADVKRVAFALMRAGIRIRLISPFVPARADRKHLIQVGSMEEGDEYGGTPLRDRPYTEAEMRSATGFPLR